MRTGLGVREGVVVVYEVISAGCGDRLKLVVRQPAAEVLPGGREGVEENVVGVVHLIHAEHRFEAAFVKSGIVCHEWKSLDERLDFLPDVGEYRCVLGVFFTQTVDPLAEPLVVFGLGVDEAVERIHYLSVTHYHYAY